MALPDKLLIVLGLPKFFYPIATTLRIAELTRYCCVLASASRFCSSFTIRVTPEHGIGAVAADLHRHRLRNACLPTLPKTDGLRSSPPLGSKLVAQDKIGQSSFLANIQIAFVLLVKNGAPGET